MRTTSRTSVPATIGSLFDSPRSKSARRRQMISPARWSSATMSRRISRSV
jgi:hypothetical protein